jgi:predicted dehydrogenase
LVRHFVDEICDGTPGEGTFLDGAQSQAIVDAVVASHRRRGWVDVAGQPALST